MSCTTLLVGKNASYDGSTLIARDDDSGHGRYDPKRLVAVRPEDQPRHYRSTLSHVEIDLPDDPCAYTIAPDALRDRGILAEAGVSERNVAMSATETIAVNERVLGADPMVELRQARTEHAAGNGSQAQGDAGELAVDQFWRLHGEAEPYDGSILDTGLQVNDLLPSDAAPNAVSDIPSDVQAHGEVPGGIGEEDIITLVLPYVHTARQAVVRLGSLLEQYGTYEANGVSISDVNEVWYVETIGGHHWIAKRVPDDCYAAIPNQLGIDDFDLEAALAYDGDEQKPCDFLCSQDMREFIAANHLDRSMESGEDRWRHMNPRHVFGTATTKDHIYNTPRAWYMQRCLNPSDDWDSPDARFTPISEDMPWARVPERKVTLEDMDMVLSSHYEDTPYDPYGRLGTEETRHRYRPIGISRTGHMAIMQIRPYMPESYRSLMWLAFGAQPFTCPVPFYTSVADTPAYLRDTTGEVDTNSLYWTNRLISVIADAHYNPNSNALEAFHEDVMGHGHMFVDQTDQAAHTVAQSTSQQALRTLLERANQRMSDYLQARNQKLLSQVLFTSSDLMNNAFALSDRPR